MKILYGKSIWGMFPCEAERFLDRAKTHGFDAVEMIVYWLKEPPERVAHLCTERGIQLVAQILTEGNTPAEHLRFLEEKVRLCAALRPALINIHTGRDYYPLADNLPLFRRAAALAAELGVRVTHETHRARALFAAHASADLLRAVPELRLCADFSHWFCVAESDLADQPAAVDLAIARADYLHARVGFAEGPQVPHPLTPAFAPELERHVGLWRRILAARRTEGCASFLVTPEFGPLPYMPRLPWTGQPVGDEWAINVEFRNWLREHLA